MQLDALVSLTKVNRPDFVDSVRFWYKAPIEDIPQLFSRGNSKLGRSILSWGLPAVHTCPGATLSCKKYCYAAKNRYSFGIVDRYRWRNLAISARPDFAGIISRCLYRQQPPAIRIHDSGDFYDAQYLAAWQKIIRRHRHLRFYFYTRSWLVPDLVEPLRRLCGLRNVVAWLSADQDVKTGPNFRGKYRVAYLQLTETDSPGYPSHLIFRRHKLRERPAKKVEGVTVCPLEQGTKLPGTFTCQKCGICIEEPTASSGQGGNKRISLAIC